MKSLWEKKITKTLLIVFLIMILLTLSIKSTAQQVTLLQVNQPAPYQGALLPLETLRNLQTDHLNAALYKTELEKHESNTPLYQPSDHSLDVIIAIVCLGLGYWAGNANR